MKLQFLESSLWSLIGTLSAHISQSDHTEARFWLLFGFICLIGAGIWQHRIDRKARN
jgi:hypothetical protein